MLKFLCDFVLTIEQLRLGCRDSKTVLIARFLSLCNVARDLNTTELIFEENRKYCNNKGRNTVTNESYCSLLHSKFRG